MIKKRFVLFLVLLLTVTAVFSAGPAAFAQTGSDLVITGVIDGPLSGGVPKAIELYVLNDIADLSAYGLGSANNGGGSDGQEFTFPADSATTGSYIYVASETTGFTNFFGFAPDYTSSAASINGDDAIELFQSGAVVDVFGDINTDGTGQPWEYMDGWAYRVDGTGPDGSTFVLTNWTFSGPNALDGETSNATATTPFPIGTYTAGSTAVTPVINEFVFNHTGTDTNEFVEVKGEADTDYASLTILEIEGDSSGAGTIDGVFPVGTTNADGYWTTGFLNNQIENGTVTLLLVEGFSGAAGDDLDTDNDGTLDSTPWTSIVDDVAVTDGGGSDQTYAAVTLAGGFDGVPYTPGGASRIPDGVDTDTAADWMRNDYHGAGLPGFSGTPEEGEAFNTPDAMNEAVPPPPPGGFCGDPATLISAVQGNGFSSPEVGNTVIIEGVVVGDFQNNGMPDNGDLRGFFVQEEDADADGDPATSEGIFVYDSGGAVDVANGNVVRVQGDVSEYYGMTQISASTVTVCDGTATATPAAVTLPVAGNADLESVEGMGVVFPQELVIAEYYNFDRYGEIVLAAPDGVTNRPFQPTAVFEPGSPEAAALQDLNDRSRITLDDGRTSQNPDPALHPNGGIFDLTNTFRGGDIVEDVTGVLNYSFGSYKIQPTEGADYTPVNPRTAQPDDVGGSLQVATFNVLNYFTTLDDSGPICGPSGNLGCRGADNAEEFTRQRTKIIAAISAIDADVVGLMEIENNDAAIQDLVAGLNDAMGAGTYAYIDTGAIGTDAIKVAFIYKPASVTPLGSYAVLDDPSFTDPNNLGSPKNRPALAQTFLENSSGGVFTAVVNHLKSKGSSCGAGDDDAEQGNCNLTRTLAAQALVDWLATDPTNSNDFDFLIIGDLNSYDKEDPIDAFAAGADDIAGTGDDFTDLLQQFVGEYAYTYVFSGQFGYLDYGMANQALLNQVTGATVWHINADEPDILDYDTTYKKAAQDALYEPNAYRSSDHDPVIVGLELSPYALNADGCYVVALEGSPYTGPATEVTTHHRVFNGKWWLKQEGLPRTSCLEIHGTDGRDLLLGSRGDDTLFGYNGRDFLVGRAGDDTFTGGNGRDRFIGNRGYDTVLDYEPGVDRCSSIENGCD